MSSGIIEELELLERVLLRLGCAETDDQLQNAITKFLAPVLLKITSVHENVRKKVMEILTHINKRLKSRPLIQLPIEPLLRQYQATSSSFELNFTIIYITMGFPRLEVAKQTELAPILLNCLEGKPETHQDKLLILVLPLLGAIKIPEDPEKRHTLLGLTDKPSTKKQLISLLEDVLLLPYGVTQEGEVPSGMSTYSFKRVVANNWKAEELEQMKKGIVRFLSSGVFTEIDSLAPLVIASADTRFSVATPAIAELSKFSAALDWMNPVISSPLYTLFSGNGSKIPDRKSGPCSARVRQKLLQYLLKCRGRGINTAKGIQVIFEALFGENSNQKCKVLALQFADNLIKDAPKDLMSKVSRVILSGLSKLVGSTSNEAIDVQSAAYCAIAQLARVCPEVVNKDLQMVVQYFNDLSESSSELHSPLREALVAIAQAFSLENLERNKMETDKFTPNSNQTLLLALLGEHSESKSAIVQNVASVFLTTCFPQSYAPARYLLLIIAGERPQLREAVMVYLYGISKKDHVNYSYISSVDSIESATGDEESNKQSPEQLRIVLPGFKEMINHTFEIAQKRCANPQQSFLYGKTTLAYTLETYTEILDYIRLTLWYSSGATSYPGDPKSSYLIGEYIRKNYTSGTSNEIQKYVDLVKNLVKARRGHTELSCLLDLLNVVPELLAQQNMDLMEIFSSSLMEVSEDTRNLVGKLYGILLAHGYSDAEFNSEIKEMLKMSQRSLEHKHGSIVAISNAFNRKLVLVKTKENCAGLNEFVELLISFLKVTQPLLISAGVKGISLIGSVTELPLPELETDEKMDLDEEETPKLTKDYVMKLILKLLSSGGIKNKIREESAHCLGHLTIGDGKYFTKKILSAFLALNKLTKDPALHIAIGQALVYTVQGSVDAITDKKEDFSNSTCDDEMFQWFLTELIKIVPLPHVYSRQACAIWLLALVKNCSNRGTILAFKATLQAAFTDLLGEDNELVQDVASRGLGIVYSLSDADDQTGLANDLLETLTGGNRKVKLVTDDTKLFEEGVLGKTPMGGNITTYRELCSLASDLNQPEMIYQFMQLANHNAVWNSKLGAAFGLKSISKSAKVNMQPYLGKIVPRLFRYKYDPTPKIQNSMVSIWDSIVTDTKDTIDRYYWEIYDELVTNLTHPEWRVRIACCLAVRDLLKRPGGLNLKSEKNVVKSSEEAGSSSKMETDEVKVPEPELEKLWSQLFRVMDDIHEGTRLAADGTATVLSKICVIAASSDHGKSGYRVASSILPLFLETGITHIVPEVRKLSIRTISDLIDSAGNLIISHLDELIPCLLSATGELEGTKLSYLSAQHAGSSDTQEVIDSFRAEAAKHHYCSETLSKCLKYVDYPTLEKMTPKVLDIMKSSVSLGTKISCANFLCALSSRLGVQMQPLIAKYLKACFNGLSDRNATVRRHYASAMGHLIGYAKESSIIKSFEKLTSMYFDDQTNRGVPHAIHSANKRHTEILKDFAPQLLPLLFFAMHEEVTEENKSTVEQWNDLWIDISPGDAGIRLNLDAIIPLLEKSIDNPSWLLKAQAASSVSTIATRLGTNLDDGNRIKLTNMILKNISGRTFKGKERFLQALASLCKHLKKDESNLHIKIIDAIMKECRKEEPVYRTQSLKALGVVLDVLKEDRFEEVYNMVWYLLDKHDVSSSTSDDESKNLTSDERNKRAVVSIGLKEAVCETLGKAWPNNSEETQEKYQILFVEKCVQCLKNNTRPVQISLLVALGRFLDRLKVLEKSEEMVVDNKEKKVKIDEEEVLGKICGDVLSAVVYVSGIPHTGLKKEALNTVLILAKKLKVLQNLKELAILQKTFDEILTTLQKDNSPEVRCRLKDIEDKLKE